MGSPTPSRPSLSLQKRRVAGPDQRHELPRIVTSRMAKQAQIGFDLCQRNGAGAQSRRPAGRQVQEGRIDRCIAVRKFRFHRPFGDWSVMIRQDVDELAGLVPDPDRPPDPLLEFFAAASRADAR